MRGVYFVGLLMCFLGFANAAEIAAVRLSSEPQRTTVVFDLSEPLKYRLATFKNPDRLVVDFYDTRAAGALKLENSRSMPIKGLRYARRAETDLRVVLDLLQPLSAQARLLAPSTKYGHRLVLNLSPKAGAKRKSSTPTGEKRTPVVAAPSVAKPRVVAAKTKSSVKRRDIVIAVDAGHGGEDVGAIGPSGVYEKDLVMQISRELVATINRHRGMRGVLVRSGDYYVGLRERMIKAREAQADLFISIHADAFTDRRVRGSSVYVLSQRGASSEAAHWLAENENAADLIGGVRLDDKDDVLKSVLLDLSQTASLDASIDAAKSILTGLKRLGKVHKRDVQHAGFMVLKSPDIPSLLIETAFISNPSEEKRLRSKAFQRKLAAAMFGGIKAYFAENTPPGTRLAEARRHRVTRGDSLSVIAERYEVSMESIKLANNIRGDNVKLGETLTIP